MLLLSLTIVLLATAVNPAQGQAMREIKEDGVILDCEAPEEIEVTWKGQNTKDIKSATYEVKAEQGTVSGFYSCQYTETDAKEEIMHKFYLKIKVCKNCYELSGLTAWGVIFVDLLITGGLIIIIYCCTRNSDGAQKKASSSRSINPPPPPNPDYAPLDPKTRNNAVYSGIR